MAGGNPPRACASPKHEPSLLSMTKPNSSNDPIYLFCTFPTPKKGITQSLVFIFYKQQPNLVPTQQRRHNCGVGRGHETASSPTASWLMAGGNPPRACASPKHEPSLLSMTKPNSSNDPIYLFCTFPTPKKGITQSLVFFFYKQQPNLVPTQ